MFSSKESCEETHSELQTCPTAERSLPENPDEAAAHSPGGNGRPLTLPDNTPVILLCHKSNQAAITLQTTGCNYTVKSQSLEGGE